MWLHHVVVADEGHQCGVAPGPRYFHGHEETLPCAPPPLGIMNDHAFALHVFMLYTGFIHVQQDVIVAVELLMQPPVPPVEQSGLCGRVATPSAVGGQIWGTRATLGCHTIVW